MANIPAMFQHFYDEFQQHVPALFGGRILYVGANRHAPPTYVDALREAGCEIHLLEAYHENAMYYEFEDTERFDSVTEGDVRDLTSPFDDFDAILWWHGPEHLQANEWPGVLANLETLAPLVVVGCPWGQWAQTETEGNAFEEHLCSVYPADLEACGYYTMTLGAIDAIGFIAAWKGVTGALPRAGWYYATLATSHTFWLVNGVTRRALRNAAELYRYGLYPVRVVSEETLEAMPIEGE